MTTHIVSSSGRFGVEIQSQESEVLVDEGEVHPVLLPTEELLKLVNSPPKQWLCRSLILKDHIFGSEA